MRTFSYPAHFDPEDGGFVVTFPDFPDAVTQGDDLADALDQAADCLSTALVERIARAEEIPVPSPMRAGLVRIAPDATTAAKAALYLAFREADLSQSELARRLGIDPKEVRRLLAPREITKLPRIEAALAALGQRIELTMRGRDEDAPAVRRAARPRVSRRSTRALRAKRRRVA